MNFGDFEPHWLWLMTALLLGIAELMVPGVFLIFLAAAAALTGLAALILGVPVLFQLALFPLFALASVYAGRRWYSGRDIESSDPLLNDRLARHAGEIVVVVGAIEDGRGRVKLGDGVWPAKGPDAPVGARVRIVGAEGTCLRVEPVALPPQTLPAPQD